MCIRDRLQAALNRHPGQHAADTTYAVHQLQRRRRILVEDAIVTQHGHPTYQRALLGRIGIGDAKDLLASRDVYKRQHIALTVRPAARAAARISAMVARP